MKSKAMSERREKKMRRVIRKQYGEQLVKIANEKVKIIKTKPKIIPMWLWKLLLSIFIKKTI
jgi:hypothetical protein